MARSSRPLANRRVIAGYTQEGLAEALGVDRTTIGRWERGKQQPQPWQRPDLAHKLGITLEQLDGMLRPQSVGADVA
ncbi:helix-turn-helix transcriptional regulator [Prauserella endophytica]|uniref:Helix-turn-helix transcriptional regulator n=1 Tax=Prauserella endophytica TaxID=1592324 RepID=A0ABY2RZA0_9PSEU|nr:helix-turn-helix transcriptional regulator [Prauserella endophytica]TKG66263.1 helix-turn-helix transcriptional regulator [Prauserella endophytica]